MRQYITPKLLFAGLLMLAMSGMASCNDGSPEKPETQTEQPVTGQDNVVAASDEEHVEDHDNDPDDTEQELEKTKHLLSELSGKVETLESQLSEYKQGLEKANEKLKDEFGFIKIMAILAIVFSVISIAISVILSRKRSDQNNDALTESDIRGRAGNPGNTNRLQQNSRHTSAATTQLQNELSGIRKQLSETSNKLALLQTEVTRLKTATREPQRHAQRQAPPPIDSNPRRTDNAPKTPTKTVYFEQTRNGRFENPSDVEEKGYSNYVCETAGDTAIFRPIKNMEKLRSAEHLQEAVRFEGDKDGARDAEITPGKAERDGSGWRITEKAVVRFKR